MIRLTNFAEIEAIDDLEDMVESVDIANKIILDEVHDELEAEILADLRQEPGRVRYPIQWTSERQRRAYFATNGFGSGIPYKRTGKLAQAWVVEIRGSAIVIENPSDAAKYVYGSNAQNRSAALRFKQRFHSNTGWYTATDKVGAWVDEITELYLEKFDDRLAKYAKSKVGRRAFTR